MTTNEEKQADKVAHAEYTAELVKIGEAFDKAFSKLTRQQRDTPEVHGATTAFYTKINTYTKYYALKDECEKIDMVLADPHGHKTYSNKLEAMRKNNPQPMRTV